MAQKIFFTKTDDSQKFSCNFKGNLAPRDRTRADNMNVQSYSQ
jgi:hypothetical protein